MKFCLAIMVASVSAQYYDNHYSYDYDYSPNGYGDYGYGGYDDYRSYGSYDNYDNYGDYGNYGEYDNYPSYGDYDNYDHYGSYDNYGEGYDNYDDYHYDSKYAVYGYDDTYGDYNYGDYSYDDYSYGGYDSVAYGDDYGYGSNYNDYYGDYDYGYDGDYSYEYDYAYDNDYSYDYNKQYGQYEHEPYYAPKEYAPQDYAPQEYAPQSYAPTYQPSKQSYEYVCHAAVAADFGNCRDLSRDYAHQWLQLSEGTTEYSLKCATTATVSCLALSTGEYVDDKLCGGCADMAFACPSQVCHDYEPAYKPAPTVYEPVPPVYEPVPPVYEPVPPVYEPVPPVYEPLPPVYEPTPEPEEYEVPWSSASTTDDYIPEPTEPVADDYAGSMFTCRVKEIGASCQDRRHMMSELQLGPGMTADDLQCAGTWSTGCWNSEASRYVDESMCGGCLDWAYTCAAGTCGDVHEPTPNDGSNEAENDGYLNVDEEFGRIGDGAEESGALRSGLMAAAVAAVVATLF